MEPGTGGKISVVLLAGPSRVDALTSLHRVADEYDVSWVQSVGAARSAISSADVDCLLVDPDLSGASAAAVADLLDLAGHAAGLVLLPTEPARAEELANDFGAAELVLPAELATRHLRRAVVSATRSAAAAGVRIALTRALAAATAGSSEAMVVLDSDDRIESVSREAELLTRTTAADLIGCPLRQVPWSWVDRDGTALGVADFAAVRSLAASDAARCGHLGVISADGVTVRVFLTATALPSPGGGVLTMRDSSEHLAAAEATRFQTALLHAMGDAVVVTDPDAIVTFWNPAAEALYGWSAAEALGRPVIEVVPAADPVHQAQSIRQSVVDGTPFAGDYLLGRRDGSAFPAIVSVAPVYDDRHALVALIGVSSDITERKRGEESARALSAIVESTADAVLSYDVTGTVLTWNRGAQDLFGYVPADIVGTPVRRLVTEATERLSLTATAATNGEIVRGVEAQGRRSDGSMVDVSLTVSPIYDQVGGVVAVSVIAHDISERRRLEQQLSHQALHDTLTGLPNRALLDDRLAQLLAGLTRHGEPVAVLFLDLDQFKSVNDTYGHLIGDGLLVEVARRLTAVTRPTDTVARFGGDEFVIVCADTDVDAAVALSTRIQHAFQAPVEVGTHRLQVSTSVGIAVTPPLDPDAEGLLRCADVALYEAKATGRARARVFDGSLDRRSHDRRQLTRDLRDALSRGALDVYYQPVFDLGSDALVGLESLLRWHHPTRGWIPPDLFLASAEQDGLAPELDAWVLGRACTDAATLRDEGLLSPSARVSVNLSASIVGEPETVETVRRAAGDARLPLEALGLEITETSLLARATGAREVLSVLRALGVAVALDDFGTGYSSLTNLLQLPVTTIKIDRSFVHDITDEADGFAIAASVINLGRALGLRTVAKGVETPAQLALLHRLGCHDGQGYLWSEALPLDRLRPLLRRGAHGFGAEPALSGAPLGRPVPEGHRPASRLAAR